MNNSDEAVRGSHAVAPALTRVAVGGCLPNTCFFLFPLLHTFRGEFPAPGSDPSQGLSFGSS